MWNGPNLCTFRNLCSVFSLCSERYTFEYQIVNESQLFLANNKTILWWNAKRWLEMVGFFIIIILVSKIFQFGYSKILFFFLSKSPVSFHLNECVKKNWFWLKKRREKKSEKSKSSGCMFEEKNWKRNSKRNIFLVRKSEIEII